MVLIIFAIMSQFYTYVSHSDTVANREDDDILLINDDDDDDDDDENETKFTE